MSSHAPSHPGRPIVLACMTSSSSARAVLAEATAVANRLGGACLAAYVLVPCGSAHNGERPTSIVLAEDVVFAQTLGVRVVNTRAVSEPDGLVELAERESVTHAIFGCGARAVNFLDAGSTIGRFVRRSSGVQVQVVASTGES